MIARRLRGWLGGWQRDDLGVRRKGSFGQGYSGQKFWHLDPDPNDIQFDDICVGLSREGRYGNQTRDFYGVGEHSVLVSVYCEKLARERGWDNNAIGLVAAHGLMHDAPEAFLSDVVRPLKELRIMRGYRRLEEKWWQAVCTRFDIVPTEESHALVHEVDRRLCLDEVEALMLDPDMYHRNDGRMSDRIPLGATINAMTWQQAATVFAQRFAEVLPAWSPI